MHILSLESLFRLVVQLLTHRAVVGADGYIAT